MHNFDELMRIGQFAKATRLSIKALRIYARMGLLSPAYVDPESGYRFYSVEQLEPARLMRTLRQIEMPLEAIRVLMMAEPTTAVSLLQQYQQNYAARAQLVRQTTNQLIIQFKGEVFKMTAQNLSVEMKNIPERTIVSVKKEIAVHELDDTISTELKRLEQFIAARNGRIIDAPFGIFHGAINETDNGPLEICIPVAEDIGEEDNIVSRILPATQAASVTMRGEMCNFPHILQAYDATNDWVRANGGKTDEPPREVWHAFAGPDAVMEVLWPYS